MAAFRYLAVDLAGKTKKGVLEFDTLRQARSHLRDNGLLPIEVEAISQRSVEEGGKRGWRLKKGFSSGDLSLLTRQFATLLSAGMTVEASLTALTEQAENEYARQVLAGVRAEVMSGHTLARAMSQYKNVFPDIYYALIHAGEESGDLSEVMLRLADYTENRNALRTQIMLAFIYPIAVTVVAIAVISGLLVFVVPQVVGVFLQSHQTLPFLTRALISLSDFLRTTGIFWLVLLILSVLGIRKALSREALRLRFHEFLLKIPLVGSLIRGLNTARLSSTLAILVGSGVPLLKAMQAGALIVGNLPMRHAVEKAMAMVKEGYPLSRALSASKKFPPILIHLISSGESSGRLAQMLERAAHQQEQEMENKTAVLTGLMEPALIVVMGGIVLLIVLAILLPIIEMNQLVR